MGSFLNNRKAYNIQSETETAVILSNASTEFIYGVIGDILNTRLQNFDLAPRPNYVLSYETDFKQMLEEYPDGENNTRLVRDKTYEEIIGIIAKSFDLQVNFDETVDRFTLASAMFDFFVSNYDQYVCQFFSKFITREKDGLYNALNLDDDKKSKDVTTLYNKKQYNDPKMAIINSNLDRAIGYIKQLDFTMEDILTSVYPGRPEVVSMFSDHVKPLVDFFKSSYVSLLENPMIYPLALLAIKIELQKLNSNAPEFLI